MVMAEWRDLFLKAVGDYLYVGVYPNQVATLDISEPWDPFVIGLHSTSYSTHQIEATADAIFAREHEAGISVYHLCGECILCDDFESGDLEQWSEVRPEIIRQSIVRGN